MATLLDTKLLDLKKSGLLVEEISNQDAEFIAGGNMTSLFGILPIKLKFPSFFSNGKEDDDNGDSTQTVNEYVSPDGNIYNYESTNTSYYRDSSFM